MKLTDKAIACAFGFPHEVKTDQMGEFRAGAQFARDYYEKQIAGLIGSLTEQLLSAPYDWGKLESILNRFDDGNGSNP